MSKRIVGVCWLKNIVFLQLILISRDQFLAPAGHNANVIIVNK